MTLRAKKLRKVTGAYENKNLLKVVLTFWGTIKSNIISQYDLDSKNYKVVKK